jgi:hypothetical protein
MADIAVLSRVQIEVDYPKVCPSTSNVFESKVRLADPVAGQTV